jgi:hypothetical protein
VITVNWNKKEWHDTGRELRKFKNQTVPEFVRYRARIVCADLIAYTPPTGDSPSSEGSQKQLKIGQRAVNRDISRFWRSAASVLRPIASRHPRAAQALEKYIRAGDASAVQTMLRDFGIRSPVVVEVTEAMHDTRRVTERGSNNPPTLVLRVNSLKRLARLKMSHVGKWKSGWGLAAVSLGVAMRDFPLWVRKQGYNGGFKDLTNQPDRPSAVLINDVKGSQDAATAEILEDALALNEEKLNKELQAILAYTMRKHSAK